MSNFQSSDQHPSADDPQGWVPFFTEHDGSPIIDDRRNPPSSPPLNKEPPFLSCYDRRISRMTVDKTPFRSTCMANGHDLQAPETPNDQNADGRNVSDWTVLSSMNEGPYTETKSRSAPEHLESVEASATDGAAAIDTHRKSKTEFGAIPSEVIRIGLDLAKCPNMGFQAHRKSSTEFKHIMAEGMSASIPRSCSRA